MSKRHTVTETNEQSNNIQLNEQTSTETEYRLKNRLKKIIQTTPPTDLGLTINGVKERLEFLQDSLKQQIDIYIDQVEDQIKDIKTTLLSLYELLLPRPLQKSDIVFLNIPKEELFTKDPVILQNSFFARSFRQNHNLANDTETNGVHGIFLLFGCSTEDDAEFLKILADFAKERATQVYFSPDVKEIWGQEPLPSDVRVWIKKYGDSSFYHCLTQAEDNRLRRLTAMFNPILLDTKRLNRSISAATSNSHLVDKLCYGSPVVGIAKRLVENYEKFGHANEISGLSAGFYLREYNNNNPIRTKEAIAFSPLMEGNYISLLWDFSGEQRSDFANVQLNPLKRHPNLEKKTGKKSNEIITIIGGQTMIRRPGQTDQEKTDISTLAFWAAELAKKPDKIKEFRSSLSQDDENRLMNITNRLLFYNLTTCLIEDIVVRGLTNLAKSYIGRSSDSVVANLKIRIAQYLSIFCKPPNTANDRDSNTYPLKQISVEKCEVIAETVHIKIKIFPNETVQKVHAFIEMVAPFDSVFDFDSGSGKGD